VLGIGAVSLTIGIFGFFGRGPAAAVDRWWAAVSSLLNDLESGTFMHSLTQIFAGFIYSIWLSIASIADLVQAIFMILAGVQPFYRAPVDINFVDGYGNPLTPEQMAPEQGFQGDLVSTLINSGPIQTIFTSMVAVATVLLIFFTVLQLIRSQYKEKDGGNPYLTVFKMIKGMVLFMFISAAVTVGLFLSGIMLNVLNTATTFGTPTTMSGMVFYTMATQANRATHLPGGFDFTRPNQEMLWRISDYRGVTNDDLSGHSGLSMNRDGTHSNLVWWVVDLGLIDGQNVTVQDEPTITFDGASTRIPRILNVGYGGVFNLTAFNTYLARVRRTVNVQFQERRGVTYQWDGSNWVRDFTGTTITRVPNSDVVSGTSFHPSGVPQPIVWDTGSGVFYLRPAASGAPTNVYEAIGARFAPTPFSFEDEDQMRAAMGGGWNFWDRSGAINPVANYTGTSVYSQMYQIQNQLETGGTAFVNLFNFAQNHSNTNMRPTVVSTLPSATIPGAWTLDGTKPNTPYLNQTVTLAEIRAAHETRVEQVSMNLPRLTSVSNGYNSGYRNNAYEMFDDIRSSRPLTRSNVAHTLNRAIEADVSAGTTIIPSRDWEELITAGGVKLADYVTYIINNAVPGTLPDDAPRAGPADIALWIDTMMICMESNYWMVLAPSDFIESRGVGVRYFAEISFRSHSAVMNLYSLWGMSHFIGWFGIFIVVGVLINFVFGLVQRIVELLILYMLSPLTLAFYPFDDGQSFSNNFVRPFYKKTIAIFAPLMALNLFFVLLPAMRSIRFFPPGQNRIANAVASALVTLSMLTMLPAIRTQIQSMLGADALGEKKMGSVWKDSMNAALGGAIGGKIGGITAGRALKGTVKTGAKYTQRGQAVAMANKENKSLKDRAKKNLKSEEDVLAEMQKKRAQGLTGEQTITVGTKKVKMNVDDDSFKAQEAKVRKAEAVKTAASGNLAMEEKEMLRIEQAKASKQTEVDVDGKMVKIDEALKNQSLKVKEAKVLEKDAEDDLLFEENNLLSIRQARSVGDTSVQIDEKIKKKVDLTKEGIEKQKDAVYVAENEVKRTDQLPTGVSGVLKGSLLGEDSFWYNKGLPAAGRYFGMANRVETMKNMEKIGDKQRDIEAEVEGEAVKHVGRVKDSKVDQQEIEDKKRLQDQTREGRVSVDDKYIKDMDPAISAFRNNTNMANADKMDNRDIARYLTYVSAGNHTRAKEMIDDMNVGKKDADKIKVQPADVQNIVSGVKPTIDAKIKADVSDLDKQIDKLSTDFEKKKKDQMMNLGFSLDNAGEKNYAHLSKLLEDESSAGLARLDTFIKKSIGSRPFQIDKSTKQAERIDGKKPDEKAYEKVKDQTAASAKLDGKTQEALVRDTGKLYESVGRNFKDMHKKLEEYFTAAREGNTKLVNDMNQQYGFSSNFIKGIAEKGGKELDEVITYCRKTVGRFGDSESNVMRGDSMEAANNVAARVMDMTYAIKSAEYMKKASDAAGQQEMYQLNTADTEFAKATKLAGINNAELQQIIADSGIDLANITKESAMSQKAELNDLFQKIYDRSNQDDGFGLGPQERQDIRALAGGITSGFKAMDSAGRYDQEQREFGTLYSMYREKWDYPESIAPGGGS